jgi:metal-responsive CopG/Arc/MetJ family transcriptional regulator
MIRGRKKTIKKSVNLSLNQNLLEEIDTLADKRGVKRQHIISKAIIKYLNEEVRPGAGQKEN